MTGRGGEATGGGGAPRAAIELLEQRAQQRRVVADLGRSALTGATSDELARSAARIPIETMSAELSLVLHLGEDDHLVTTAAHGFDADVASSLRVGPDPRTFLRAALDTTPLLVTDWGLEDRFEPDELLRAGKIRSACTATIRGVGGRPAGVIAALSTVPERFTDDDCNFLRTIANVLAAARVRQDAEDGLRESIARLDTLLASSPGAFAFVDTELRFVRVNERMASLSGLPVSAHLGRKLFEVLPDIWLQLEDGLRAVLSGDEPAREDEVSAQLAGAPGLERHFLVSSAPVRTSDGEVLGLGMVVVDITERTRAERAARLLSAASELLAQSRDLERVLDDAVQLPLPEFADSCQLFLFADDGRPWHAATAHSDGTVTRLAVDGGSRYPIDPETPGAISEAVTTGRAQLVAHVPAETIRSFAHDDDHLRMIEAHAAGSAIVAPLRARGTTLGLAFFTFTGTSNRRYRPDDVPVAEELAARFAHLVDTRHLEVEAERARQRVDVLARAGALMTVDLDAGQRMGEFAAVPVPDFADACAVHLVGDDDVFRLEVLRAQDEKLERIFVAPADWGTLPPNVPTPNLEALETRRAVLIPDLPATLRAALGPDAAETARELGLGSLLCAPLIGADGRAFGTMTFVHGASGRHYGAEDVPLAEELGRRAAAFFQHALRFEQEQATAEVLQRSLLPSTVPAIAGVAAVARYLPGGVSQRVGGDWYDVVAFRDGGATVAIGDVVGHGVVAASSTGQLRAGVHLAALEGIGPAGSLDRLNRLLLALPDGEIATVAVLLYEPAEARLRLASAGHPPPLVVRGDGECTFFEGSVGYPLRASAAAHYEEITRPFAAGDTVVLYTDGLVERRGESLDVGLERLRAALRGAPSDLEALADHVLATMLPPGGPTDDVALLVLRAVDDAPPLRLELPPRPAELAAARGALRSWLAVAGVPAERARDLVLAANEALANAVEHGTPTQHGIVTLQARVETPATVVIEVRDRGRWLDRPPEPHRGRGLGVMRAVTDHVEVSPGPHGTTITLRYERER